jgi:hypothetical protein
MTYQATTVHELSTLFGSGASGDVTLSGSHTFTDTAYNDLTLATAASLVLSGVKVFVKGSLYVANATAAKLTASGGLGGSGSAGSTGGAGGVPAAVAAEINLIAAASGEGGAVLLQGAVCSSPTPPGVLGPTRVFGGRSGKGGKGGNGSWGSPGNVTTGATPNSVVIPQRSKLTFDLHQTIDSAFKVALGGGGGGGGGGYAVDYPPDKCNGGGGGAGGASGGFLFLYVNHLYIPSGSSLTISSLGGAGGVGGSGHTNWEEGFAQWSGSGGSGGGGGGGAIILLVGRRSGTGTLSLNVSGGAGGAAIGSGAYGLGGSKGAALYACLSSGVSAYIEGSDTTQASLTGEVGTLTL